MPSVDTQFSIALDPDAVVADEYRVETSCRVELRFDLPDAGAAVMAHTHICMVLDCSGSMAGQSIEGAMQAALRIVDSTSDHHTISLVAFESRAHLLLEGVRANEKGKELMRHKIERLHKLVGGTTAMAEGIRCGMGAMRDVDADAKVMIVLSDGVANAPERAAKAAAAAADEDIQLFAVGLGTACAYLEHLVAPSNGMVFRNEEASALVETFAALLERIERFVASNVVLELRLADDVTAGETVRVRPEPTSLGSLPVEAGLLRLKLGNVEEGEDYRFDIELELPPAAPGEQRVVDALLVYDAPSIGLKRQQVRSEGWVTYVAEDTASSLWADDLVDSKAVAGGIDNSIARAATGSSDDIDDDDLDEAGPGGPELFDLILLSAGDNEILVYREARDATGVSLRHVRDILRDGGGALQKGLRRAAAEELELRLITAGASVELRSQTVADRARSHS